MNNFGIGKIKRVNQTEKKTKPQKNLQIKKYEPLCNFLFSKFLEIYIFFMQIFMIIFIGCSSSKNKIQYFVFI